MIKNFFKSNKDTILKILLYIVNIISSITCIIKSITYIPNKKKHSFPLDVAMLLLISCLILSLISFYIPEKNDQSIFCFIQAYIISFTSMINPMFFTLISSAIYLNTVYGNLVKKIKFYLKLIFVLILIFVNGIFFIMASFNMKTIFGEIGLVCEIKYDSDLSKKYFWFYFSLIFIFLFANILFVFFAYVSILKQFGVEKLKNFKHLFLYAFFPLIIYLFNCLSRTIWKERDFENYFILINDLMGFFFSLVYGLKNIIQEKFSSNNNGTNLTDSDNENEESSSSTLTY